MKARIHITEQFVEVLTKDASNTMYWALCKALNVSETYETWLPNEDGKEQLWHAYAIRSEEALYDALVTLTNETTADSLCYRAEEMLDAGTPGTIIINNNQLADNNKN